MVKMTKMAMQGINSRGTKQGCWRCTSFEISHITARLKPTSSPTRTSTGNELSTRRDSSTGVGSLVGLHWGQDLTCTAEGYGTNQL